MPSRLLAKCWKHCLTHGVETWFTRYMTTTQPTTVTAIDRNTGRQINWNVVFASNTYASPAGWTNTLMVSRPNGKKCFSMCVEIDPNTGQVIRQSTARPV